MQHHTHDHHMIQAVSSKNEYAKFFVVIGTILTISFFVTAILPEISFMEWMRVFMGIFFLVFAAFKLIGYKMFTVMFAGYDIIAKRFKVYAYAYPFLELGLGLMYLLNFVPVARDILTLLVMTIGAIGVGREVARRSGVHCACLGNVIRLPLSTVSLVEDVSMGLLAALMLAWRLF